MKNSSGGIFPGMPSPLVLGWLVVVFVMRLPALGTASRRNPETTFLGTALASRQLAGLCSGVEFLSPMLLPRMTSSPFSHPLRLDPLIPYCYAIYRCWRARNGKVHHQEYATPIIIAAQILTSFSRSCVEHRSTPRPSRLSLSSSCPPRVGSSSTLTASSPPTGRWGWAGHS